MSIYNFIFGPMRDMEKPAYSWWNSKRKEYNIKFLLCLLSSQMLFLLVFISLNGVSDDILYRMAKMVMTDLLIVALINLIYFIWPTIEITIFRKVNILYRKYCFALLNIINALIFIASLIAVFIIKI